MGADWKELERRIGGVTKSARRPVAVIFLDAEPVNIDKFYGREPSSCSFWRLAAEGRTFYTLPEDHFNGAVGAYTLNIPLSADREKETEQTLGMMFELGYVKSEEVPEMPRLRADVGVAMPALGRPTCLAVPAALQHGTVTSLGCIGNRVYTGLGEDEMYVVLRGKDLAAVSGALKTIENANAALKDYAKGRRQQLSTI